MRFLVIATVLAFSSCVQLVSQMATTDDPAKVKERVLKLVEEQRGKKDWMKADACPVDTMPENGRRSKGAVKDCEANPDKCLSSCEGGNADSCYALARLIQDNDTADNDVADVLYRRACSLGITSGCTNAASNLFERENETSKACAARTFESACSQNDPWACTMNGRALAEGIGRTKNVAEAIRSLDKTCDVSVDKNGEACLKAKELKAVIEKTQKLQSQEK